MNDVLTNLLIDLHGSVGDLAFGSLAVLIALALSLFLIPVTTDAMVNASAGLTGKYLGDSYRTLVINSSTNNPEVFSMFIAFLLGKIGGIANPLGSNFANIYLMFLVASGYVMLKWVVLGQKDKLNGFIGLVKKEKGLVAWHLVLALLMFGLSSCAYYLLTDSWQFVASDKEPEAPTVSELGLVLLLCAIGAGGYFFFERRLNKQRPELFEDIDEDEHVESWFTFAWGTAGLIVCCYIINALFLACSTIYESALTAVLGTAVFAGLHYFAGALVTSLPEMNVAVKNYQRLTTPDLNTAMASASASNATNLAIAVIGTAVALLLVALGITLDP